MLAVLVDEQQRVTIEQGANRGCRLIAGMLVPGMTCTSSMMSRIRNRAVNIARQRPAHDQCHEQETKAG